MIMVYKRYKGNEKVNIVVSVYAMIIINLLIKRWVLIYVKEKLVKPLIDTEFRYYVKMDH